MGKQIVPKRPKRALRHIDHDSVIRIGRQNPHAIETRHPCDCICQRRKIRRIRHEERRYVIVNQIFHEHGSLYIGKYAHENQCDYCHIMELIILEHIRHQPFKYLHWILDLRFYAPWYSSHRSRHL